MADVLVTTDWVAQHAKDADVRVVEVDVDTTAYDQGHVPGAVGWNWTTELCDTLVRDIIPMKKLEELLGKSGIDNDTTIVLYGDNNNWFAAWAFWQLKMYGHKDVRIMDGGRKKWLAEARELSTEKPALAAKTYKANGARRLAARVSSRRPAGVGAEEGRARGRAQPGGIHRRDPRASRAAGDVPARRPHSRARRAFRGRRTCNDDGTFKSVDELKKLYARSGDHRRRRR